MARIETTTLIKAPLPQVFKFVSDWQKWADWFEGVSDFKPRSRNSDRQWRPLCLQNKNDGYQYSG